jgi:DNA-binding beta-propeller fold protein YncE
VANPRGLPLNRAEALARARDQATNAPPPSTRGWERRLYVAGKAGLSLHDIDAGHRLLRRIELAGDYTGIGASVALGKLYLASRASDELVCFDLRAETVTWRRRYGPSPGSLAVTPDGRMIYLPCRDDGDWWVLNAATGDVMTKVSVGRGHPPRENPSADSGPFHTWCNRSGTRMFLSVLSVPDVFIADVLTHEVVGAIGDFTRGVNAFAVTADERFVFACVGGLLGFEVGEFQTGRMISRVESRPPAERLRQLNLLPQRQPQPTSTQAIAVHPNQREVWLTDHAHGFLYVYDVSRLPARAVASVPLFEKPEDRPRPGWLTFGIDGRYAYVGGVGAIDTQARRVAVRFPTSDAVLEVDFWAGRPYQAGSR